VSVYATSTWLDTPPFYLVSTRGRNAVNIIFIIFWSVWDNATQSAEAFQAHPLVLLVTRHAFALLRCLGEVASASMSVSANRAEVEATGRDHDWRRN